MKIIQTGRSACSSLSKCTTTEPIPQVRAELSQELEGLKINRQKNDSESPLKIDQSDFYSICSIDKNLFRQNLGIADHTFISKADFSFYLFTTNIFE